MERTQSNPAEAGAPRPEALLLSPLLVLALVALALNDHVAKALWPGLVTGKLSDLLGLFVFPLLVWAGLDRLGLRSRSWAASQRRLAVIAAATGIGFAALKALPLARGWFLAAYEAVGLRAQVAPDLTDLFCLPALLVAVGVGLRLGSAPIRYPDVRRVAGLAVLIAGIVVSTASSWAPPVPVRAQVVSGEKELPLVHDLRLYDDRPFRIVLPDGDYREVRVLAPARVNETSLVTRYDEESGDAAEVGVAPVLELRGDDPALRVRPLEIWLPRSRGAWHRLAKGEATEARLTAGAARIGAAEGWGYWVEVVRRDGSRAAAEIRFELEEESR